MKPRGPAWRALGAAILGLLAFAAFAQPVYQSSQTAVGTGNATVTKPASTASGDLLIVGLMVEKGSAETITAPGGWNLIRRTDESTNAGMATYYKVAGGAEPANYTFTIANGSKWAIGISRITGADTTSPIHAHQGQVGTTGTTVTAPSVTTTVANTLVLAFYTNKKNSTYTGVTTERYDVPNGAGGLPSNMMASFVQASAGATGDRNATASDSEAWVGQQVAIRIPGASPATKLYFHNAATPNIGTLPGASTLSATTPNVTAAGAGTNRDMDETIGTAQVSAALTTLAVTSLQRNWFRRFLSRPLAAQTLPTGVWTIQGGAEESQNSSNMLPWGVVIKVWRPSTGATVATLIDNPELGTVEAGNSPTNIASSTSSIAGVAVNDGDILVAELWAENTQQNAQARTNTIYYDGTTEGSTTSNAAFLQAPGAITFHRSLRQSGYRLFNNANSTNVGTPLAAQDTAATLGSTSAAFRLRMLLHVADIDLGISGQAFKLQFVGKGIGTCAAPSGGTPAAYTDITAATIISYNNNAAPADGAVLTANAGDPTHGADTVVNQTYEELNNFTNTAAINKGQDGKWDFSLIDNGAAGSTTYCFRAVKSTGTPLDTYIVFPEITTAVAAAAAGGFNAYDTSTAAGAISGNIKTKIAGSTTGLDMIALNVAKTAIATTFTGTVRVEVLDASNNSGGLDANGCRPTWTVIQTLSPDPAFIAGDNGRKTISFTQANSYPNARLRITYPAGAPTVTGCSGDNFAIRPNTFAFAIRPVSDNGNWEQAGTTRDLNDVAFGSVTHKAGRPFSIRASADNAAGSPATTTNYVGAPIPTLTVCGGAACTATPSSGTFTLGASFAAGVLASDVATYDNVGSFQLQLVDSSFASVDASDGSSVSERNIASATINVGRFVPDHFAVSLNSPEFQAACGTFTYIGQVFKYTSNATRPVITVTAQNFANGTTTLYAGNWWRISNSTVTPNSQAGRYSAATANTLDTGVLPLVAADPVIDSTTPGSGVGSLTFNPGTGGTGLAFTRPTTTPTAPVAPFNADISLAVNVVDADGVAYAANPARFGQATAGNGIAFSGGKAQRFGVLRLENAVGSERMDLPIPIQTQYYTGATFTRNTDDGCTSISAANVGFSSYFGGITAANMNSTNITGLGAAFSAGFGSLTLTQPTPTPASPGAVTLTVNLTAEAKSYLQGNWGVPTYTADPTSRAAFGLYGGQPNNFIYFRENY